MGKIVSLLGVLGVGILLTVLIMSNDNQFVSAKNHGQVNSNLEKTQTIQLSQSYDVTHEEVVKLTNQFMNILVQEIDTNYKALYVKNVDELLTAFEEVTTREVAAPYVDFYYTEEADGMYILPTETPPWFVEENEYEIQRITDNKVKVIQHNQTVMDGKYTIELELTYKNNWKITKVTLI
ncbi:hypothetical protein [Oceanobacillus bengalensis]|uniref:DUF3993 domain-containing protein n=1 Tax=Oceanobacillus bengalensis TaxID=1435466 RepID=A0A494YWJ0_9BACI|nr:hypothetical protein [Oceanobacillus bengalensis]RKQ14512.1 hypothetical protein D8M05_12825 [Oceanobacillus bengalensis]